MEDKCEKCGTTVGETDNFCPNCGAPQNQTASQLEKERKRGIMIELISTLATKVKDPQDLQILQEMLTKLKP